MASWPSSLPQEVQVQGFSISPDSGGAIRTEMDSGPAFQRSRYTATTEPFSGRVWLDATQFQTFRTFYVDTLANGSVSFDWKHPITKNAATVRFDVSQPWQISAIAGTLFAVDMRLEVLP